MPKHRVGVTLRHEWDRVVEVEAEDKVLAYAAARRRLTEIAQTESPDAEIHKVYLLEEIREGTIPTPTFRDQLPLPLEV